MGSFYQMAGSFYQMTGSLYQMTGSFYQMTRSFYQMTESFYQMKQVFYQMAGSFYQMTASLYQMTGSFYQMTRSFYFLLFQLISFEHTLGHYHSVSLKTGGNVLKRKDAGEILFVEGLKSVAQGYAGNGGNFEFLAGNSNLRSFFQFLKESYLSMTGCANGMIIVDKVSSLFALGVAFNEVIRCQCYKTFYGRKLHLFIIS